MVPSWTFALYLPPGPMSVPVGWPLPSAGEKTIAPLSASLPAIFTTPDTVAVFGPSEHPASRAARSPAAQKAAAGRARSVIAGDLPAVHRPEPLPARLVDAVAVEPDG